MFNTITGSPTALIVFPADPTMVGPGVEVGQRWRSHNVTIPSKSITPWSIAE